MKSASQVQILSESVCISFFTHALRKGITPAVGKIAGKIWLSSHGGGKSV